ncbi:MAG: hypothetical protein AABX55_02055 [Nanoarchaeota archaeon]
MATILEDLGFLQFFLPVFIFLFIFALVYAVLDKFKLMGENKLLKGLVAFVIGLLFLFSQDALEFVQFLTPWFVIFVVIALFILSLFIFMGVKEESLKEAVGSPQVYWVVLILIIILLIAAIGSVFAPFFAPEEPATTPTEIGVTEILVHPRVLGALFLLIVSAFVVRFVSTGIEGKK